MEKPYSMWSASEELYELGERLFEKAKALAEKRDSYELAKMLTVIDKEVYRYEEEARKLRLKGELELDVYREIISDFSEIKRRIFSVLTERNLSSEVSKLYKLMRFSNELAGLYLREYLEEER